MTTIRITDSRIYESKQSLQSSYGIRLMREGRMSSAGTSAPSRLPGMIDGLLRVKDIAASTRPLEFWRGMARPTSGSTTAAPIQNTYDARLDGITREKAEDMALQMIDASEDGRINSITGSVNVVSERFEICNTSQVYHSEKATYVAGFVNTEADAPSHSDSVSGMGHSSARTLAGFDPEAAGRAAHDMCLRSAESSPVTVDDGCRHTIIFEPYSVGELLAFVVAPNFDLKRTAEGRSCFSRRAGDRVAPESLTICDDPRAPDGLGSHPVDAEGVPTTRRTLVREGVFADTYSDLFGYYRTAADATAGSTAGAATGEPIKPKPYGNAARMAMPMGRGADPIPASAPHNIRIEASDAGTAIPRDEMIRDVSRGLLVGRLWYTYAVNPIRGDFSCTARSGVAVIRDGQIASPAKPVRIMHNLPDLLTSVSGIGDDTCNVIQWASLPSITPSLRVENVPVRRI